MVLSVLGCFLIIFLLWSIFTKTFCILTMGWCKSNTCLIGKTVIITGGTSGLGFQTALALAGRGARVIIGDVVDTKEALQNIIEITQNTNVVGKFLDLSSLDSVRKFCDEINKDENRLDVLINNAGVGSLPNGYTKDGLQVQMEINYFGHFLLTHLLINLLKKNKSRIIFVSSIGAFLNNLTLENLNNPPIYNNEFKTINKIYSNSKLCQIIASNIFAEKLKNTSITSNAVHPGIVCTPIFSNVLGTNYMKFAKQMFYLGLNIFGKTAQEGAQTQINCALAKELENVSGEYFVDCVPFYQPKLAKDKEFCRKIWEKTEELVKMKPEEKLMILVILRNLCRHCSLYTRERNRN
nr:retinol dehydrogenase 12-like [Onthophagus taurus]